MTREQIHEAEKAISHLEEARAYIDNARFAMGIIEEGDPLFDKYSIAYNYICKALDQF